MDTLPAIGLGTMGIDDPDVIETALDVGYRHLDTAQIYRNEEAVGQGLRQSDIDREDVFVATKLWGDSLLPDDVHRTADECRDRLGLDVLDLLYVHRPVDTYRAEATLPAFDALYDKGTIARVGVSNFTVSQLDTAIDVLDAPLFAHQAEYHPLFQRPELREHAREHDYHLVAYSPLAGGKASEVPELRAVANEHDTTPEAVCIAWLAGMDHVHPVPKSSSRTHLEANMAALELELEESDVRRIESIEREEVLYPE